MPMLLVDILVNCFEKGFYLTLLIDKVPTVGSLKGLLLPKKGPYDREKTYDKRVCLQVVGWLEFGARQEEMVEVEGLLLVGGKELYQYQEVGELEFP